MTPLRVALEITPPREPRTELLLRRAQLLGARASAVHVIQRHERQPSVAAAAELAQRGIAAVWHLVSRGRTGAELEGEIARAAASGLRAALVVRGEAGPAEPQRPPALAQLVRDVRAAIPGARVGVTATPYGPRERVLARLWPKLEAGAAFVQTQPIFGVDDLAPLARAVRTRAPGVEIVPMLIPLLSSAAAEALSQRLRLPVPERVLRQLEAGGEEAGWAALAHQCRELGQSGFCDSLAVMTLGADPSKSFGERLAAALGSAA